MGRKSKTWNRKVGNNEPDQERKQEQKNSELKQPVRLA